MPQPTGSVIISDDLFNEVRSIVGYPIISDEFEIDRDNILKLCVLPAMRDYYTFFPKLNVQEYSFQGDFSINFPESAIGVVDVRQQSSQSAALGSTSSAFNNNKLFSPQRGFFQSGFANNDYYDLKDTQWLSVAVSNSYDRLLSNPQFIIDHSARTLSGNVGNTYGSATIRVKWAIFSFDFGEIPFRRINEVVRLSQSNLLSYIFLLRSQAPGTGDEEINVDNFEDKAKDLKDEVMELWRNRTKVSIIRG